ncbi:MAG: hypothetical protein FWG08_05105, partial [Propionibacteriaceae bacterium]|nr:hypothetical protein [Propionibacteriaceae bacterium]
MVVVGVMLAGCTLGGPGEEIPPPPVESSEEPSQWTKEEQAAIDAVDRYLTVWLEISQDLAGQDWNRIYKVASIEIATEDIEQWMYWAEQGYTIVGTPTFTVVEVAPGDEVDDGLQWVVQGCYDGVGTYFANLEGEPLDPDDPGSRGLLDFTVERNRLGQYSVIAGEDTGESC